MNSSHTRWPVLADEGDARPERTVVAWDLVGSTEMLMDRGVMNYVGMIRTFDGIIDQRLEHRAGTVFKNTGDGVLALFSNAGDALVSAIEVCEALTRRASDSPATLLRARTGVATGHPLADHEDYFGVAVVAAARLCAAAQPGQILATAATVEKATPLPVRPIGRLRLKGLREPMQVVAVESGGRSGHAAECGLGLVPPDVPTTRSRRRDC